jgi:hypothetical protein
MQLTRAMEEDDSGAVGLAGGRQNFLNQSHDRFVAVVAANLFSFQACLCCFVYFYDFTDARKRKMRKGDAETFHISDVLQCLHEANVCDEQL